MPHHLLLKFYTTICFDLLKLFKDVHGHLCVPVIVTFYNNNLLDKYERYIVVIEVVIT